MRVSALIGAIIAVVVGVSLIPVIVTTVSSVEENYEVAEVETTPGASGVYSDLDTPLVEDSLNGEITEKGKMPAGLKSILDMLPFVFVMIIIVGAIAWIGTAADWEFPRRRRNEDEDKEEQPSIITRWRNRRMEQTEEELEWSRAEEEIQGPFVHKSTWKSRLSRRVRGA